MKPIDTAEKIRRDVLAQPPTTPAEGYRFVARALWFRLHQEQNDDVAVALLEQALQEVVTITVGHPSTPLLDQMVSKLLK